ncbi:hypothetical protein ES708_34508 [subsurface metagenome]
MVKLHLQFPNTSLCLFKQLSYWTGVMMAFRRQGDEVFKTVIILLPVDMMNLPFRGHWSMCLFPHQDMFKNLMLTPSPRVVVGINPYIAKTSFPSTAFPIWVFIPPRFYFMAASAMSRMTIHRPATFGAWFLIFTHIYHVYIITHSSEGISYELPKGGQKIIRRRPHYEGRLG